MKDRQKKILKVTLLTIMPILIIVMLLSFLGMKDLGKTYALDEGMNNISLFVDEDDDPTSVSFVLEYLDHSSKENIDGNEVEVTAPSGIDLKFLNIETGEEIPSSNNKVTLSDKGTIVKLNGIEKGNTYNIVVKPTEKRTGLMPTYKEAVVEIDYTDNLTAKIIRLVDNYNNEVELSDNDKMVFLFTDSEDKIKLRNNEDVEISYYYSLDELTEEELATKEFRIYEKDKYLKVSTNGYLYARSKYKNNGYSKINMLRVDHIDKNAPVITHETPVERPNKKSASVTFTVSDQEETREYGKSGIVKYAFSLTDSPDDSEFIEVNQDNTYTEIVDDNGTYYVVAYDEAGNKTVHEIPVSEISWDEENFVILILQSDVPELVGREYHSLKAMKDDFESLNLTSSDKVLAQIEGNITNQSLTVENVDLTLDLNGYTINTRDDVPSFTINSDSHLKIVDNKYNINDYLSGDYSRYSHGEGYGKVNNNKNVGIKINENATLQVGEDNSPDLAHIEYPDHNSPFISGKTRAIVNNGTFNLYDGKLKGALSIDGTINDTPPLYDPSISRDEDNNYIVVLEKVTDIEALIGKTRYTLLEDAIFAANNYKGTPQDQIKIDIVKDIDKQETIEVNDQKNIILNTNGFNVSNATDKPVITNYGKLVIMNSLDTGSIYTSGSSHVIDNKYNATLTIESGLIQSGIWGYHDIVNREDATINVTGGTIKHTNYGDAIYNIGGIVNISGGNVTVTTRENEIYENRNNVLVNQDVTMSNHDTAEVNVPFSNIVNNGNYYFEETPSGILESNNTNIGATTANSYFEIDLRNVSPTVKVRINVEARTTSENGCDYGYLTIKDDTTAPTWDDASGRFYLQSGGNATSFSTYSTDVQGGQVYYLHLGYYKTGWTDHYEDKMFVKSINYYQLRTYYGRTNITGGTLSGSRVCYLNYSKGDQARVNGGTLGCEYSVYNASSVFHLDSGKLNGTIGNYGGNKTYVHGGTVNHIHNGNGTVYIEDGEVSSIQNSDTYLSDRGDEYLYITGGTIGSIDNGNFIDAKNATIRSVDSKALVDNYYDNVHFDNVINDQYGNTYTIFNTYRASSDSAYGNITFKDCEFNIDVNGNTGGGYNIPNVRNLIISGPSNITLDGVTMTNKVLNNITFGDDSYNTYRLFTGIINNGTGNLTIKDTSINLDSSINGNTYQKITSYGITNDSKSNIYLGTKDGNYLENDVVIEAQTGAISNSQGNIHFYDGTLKSSGSALNSSIEEIEDNYYVNRYQEDGKDIIKLTQNAQNVLNEDTGITYNSISEALSVEGLTDANLKLIGDYIYEPENRKVEVKSTMNINLDLNGKKVYLGDGLLNNGVLNIKDTSDKTASIRTTEIINNNTLSIGAGSWFFEYTTANGLLNNGVATISNSTYRGNWVYNQENMFNNNGTLYFENGSNLNSNGNSLMKLIYNSYTGRLYVNGGIFDAYDWIGSGQEGSLYGRIIFNKGGYVEINGGTLSGRVGGALYYSGSTTMIYSESVAPKYTVTNRDWKIWYSDGVIFMTDDGPAYYVEADLTEYEGDVTITVTSYGNYWGSQDLAITTSPNRPSTSEHYSGTIRYDEDVWSKTVQGGQKYYIHVDGSEVFTDDITITHNGVTTSLYKKGEVVINGGTIQSENSGTIFNASHTTVTMNGGLIKQISGVDGTGISISHHGTVNMNGGKILNKNYGISYDSYSTGKITGGTLEQSGRNYGTAQLNIGRGYVEIEDVTIKGTGDTTTFKGIAVAEKSVVNITGGSVSIDSSNANENIGLYTSGEALVHMKNFTINNNSRTAYQYDNNYWAAGIKAVESSNVTVNDSTIICTGNTYLHAYGIVASDSSTITLSNEDGDTDGHVSQTTPVISGTDYGINRSGGTFNYYDGIIKGNTQISGGISDRPEGYELLYGVDTEVNLPTVVLEKVIVAINTDTGEEYTTLQSAFTACLDDVPCNIQLQTNLIMSRQVEITSRKDIIFDLNNLKIDITNQKNFKNSGSFRISNGTLNVSAIQDGTALLDNYGYLEINAGTNGMKLNENEYTHSRLIMNHPDAEVVVNGGTLTSSSWGGYQDSPDEEGKVIYNLGGKVTINGGTLNGVSHSGYYRTLRSYMNVAQVPTYNVESGSRVYTTAGRIYTENDGYINVPVDLTGINGNVTISALYSTNQTPQTWLATGIYVDKSSSKPGSVTWDHESYDYEPYGEFSKTVEGGDKYYIHFRGYALLITDVSYEVDGVKTSLFKHPTFTMNGGTINESGNTTSLFMYNGTFNMTGGTITTSYDYATLIDINASSTINMTGGNVYNKGTTINVGGFSKGYFNGGSIQHTVSQGYNSTGLNVSNSKVDVDDITISLGTNGVRNAGKRCITASGNALVNINNMTCSVLGTTEIESIYATDSSTVNINGGTYTTNGGGSSTYPDRDSARGISMYGSAKVNISGNPNIKVTSASDTVKTFGIYMERNSNQTLTISNNDDAVSTAYPLIDSEDYGLFRNSGTFNFYDGKIKGDIPIYGGVTSKPEGYELYFGNDDGNYVILSNNDLVLNTDTNISYSDINSAVTACTDNVECNLKLLNNVYLFEVANIPATKIVNLDFNTKKLIAVENRNIVNKGTLKLSNGRMDYESFREYSYYIDNYGTLELNNGIDIRNENLSGWILNRLRVQLINNRANAKVIMNGGLLINTTWNEYSYGYDIDIGRIIHNNGGYVEINGGKIYTQSTKSFINTTVPISPIRTGGYYDPYIDSGCVSNNYWSRYYIPIDLSEYDGTVDLDIQYNHWSNDPVKFYITESITQPGDITPDLSITNSTNHAIFTKSLTGRRTYYLHIDAYQLTISDIRVRTTGGDNDSLFTRGKLVFNNLDLIEYGTAWTVIDRNGDIVIDKAKFEDPDGVNAKSIVLGRGSTLTANELTFKNNSQDIEMNGYSRANIQKYKSNSYGQYNKVLLSINEGYANIGEVLLESTGQGYSTGISISNGSTFDINKANISVSSDSDTYAITAGGSSNVKIGDDVTIVAAGNTNVDIGVNAGGSSTVQIGNNDGTVSTTNPSIKGGSAALNIGSSATVKWYDGVMISDKSPIVGTVNEIPQDYTITVVDNTKILQIESHVENTYEFNHSYYDSLASAIQAVSEQSSKTGMIKIWNDASLTEAVTIPQDVNVTFALEGHTISFDGLSVGIYNNGTLTIVDGEADEIDQYTSSGMTNSSGVVVQNNGSLILGATNMSNPTSPVITGSPGYTGNAPTINSGSVNSNNNLNNTLSNMGKSIIRFFASLFQPTFAYKSNDYQVNNLADNTPLSEAPKIKAVEDLGIWRNDDVNIGMVSHNYGVINVVSSVDPSQIKELKYTVEIYKDNKLVDTVVKSNTVQVLSGDKIDIDRKFFTSAHNRYNGFSLYRVVQNDVELKVKSGVVQVDSSVDNNTLFRLYYRKNTPPVTKTTEQTTEETTEETTTEETTDTTTRRRTTTEEVKGDDIEIHVKEPFPWWIILAVVGGLGIIGLLIWLLPILLRKKVLIGISGSVGSAVAAKLLQEKNYKVSALFINNGKNLDQLTYARQVCDKLGIDLYEQDITQTSKDNINKTITSYPTIDLDKVYNKYVLIDTLKMVSKDLHIGHISCGVYARKEGERIIPGVNQVFDESEKMSLLSEEDIKKLVLPLGEIEYQDINKIAEANNVNYRSEKVDAKDKIGINNIPNE